MREPDPYGAPQTETSPAALATMSRIRVAFQGELGAFSEEAVHRLWRGEADPVPAPTFEAVMEMAESGKVDYGLLPIESTLVGGIDVTYDLLSLHDGLSVVAEVVVPVHLCLLGLPGATLHGIRSLSSHPVMLGQCSYFLDRHKHIKPEPTWDSAGAAREVAESGDPTRAAAGSRRAAERFGLTVLHEHLEDRPDSQMRFLALSPEPKSVPRGIPARTSVLAIFAPGAGTLVAALQPMADAGYNICHLVSRPTREPWQYQFFVEFEHPSGDRKLSKTLTAIRAASAEFRILGTYPRWPLPEALRERRPPW